MYLIVPLCTTITTLKSFFVSSGRNSSEEGVEIPKIRKWFELFPCRELIQFPFSSPKIFPWLTDSRIVQNTMTLSSPHEHLPYNDSAVDDVGNSISNGGGLGELSANTARDGGFMILHRLLASDDAPTVDYAILGIVVITLGLVLLVEAVRHSVSAYKYCVALCAGFFDEFFYFVILFYK